MPAPNLDRLPAYDPESGDVLAIVETPRGSRNKYAFDADLGTFRLKFVLPSGMAFPYDFGFIPSTKADDGDPLDVLVLMDDAVPPGCVVNVRIVGAITCEEMPKEAGDWVRNDRLIAVATRAHLHERVRTLDDVDPRLLDEIEAFFAQYETLVGKTFRVSGRIGPDEAAKLIETGQT